MNTKEWINAIPEVNRKHLVLYSDLIHQYSAKGHNGTVTEYAKKMRGYLECMKDCGIITESGVKALYLYYRSVRVEYLDTDSTCR